MEQDQDVLKGNQPRFSQSGLRVFQGGLSTARTAAPSPPWRTSYITIPNSNRFAIPAAPQPWERRHTVRFITNPRGDRHHVFLGALNCSEEDSKRFGTALARPITDSGGLGLVVEPDSNAFVTAEEFVAELVALVSEGVPARPVREAAGRADAISRGGPTKLASVVLIGEGGEAVLVSRKLGMPQEEASALEAAARAWLGERAHYLHIGYEPRVSAARRTAELALLWCCAPGRVEDYLDLEGAVKAIEDADPHHSA